MMITRQFDLLIVGAGLTGLTLANALAGSTLKIAVIDKHIAFGNGKEKVVSDREMRAIALSYSSQLILKQSGLWEPLESQACPIKQIHISDRGHFGFTRIHAKDYPVPHLGSVVAMQTLQQILVDRLKTRPAVSLFDSASIEDTGIDRNQRQITVKINNQSMQMMAPLVVCADGSNSNLRQLLDIPVTQTDYRQTAVVANVGVNRQQNHIAHERFTASGPLALLPISNRAFSIVWTLKPEAASEALQLSDADFLAQLQQAFGYRVGRFEWVSQRQSFPLSLIRARQCVAEHAVLIGNAAHTLHPVAGQGFNLGLRDVAVMVDEIQNGSDIPGSRTWLENYSKRRKQDYQCTTGVTNCMVRLFSNNVFPLNISRNLALLGLDMTPLKHQVAKKMMGFIPALPQITMR